jgi:hypothetical protein
MDQETSRVTPYMDVRNKKGGELCPYMGNGVLIDKKIFVVVVVVVDT